MDKETHTPTNPAFIDFEKVSYTWKIATIPIEQNEPTGCCAISPK